MRLRRLHHVAGQGERAHVGLVGARDREGLVEEVQHGHRAQLVALGEAGGVLQGVHRRAPDREPLLAHLLVEAGPSVVGVVQQAMDARVDELCDLGAGVDAPEAEQRVGAHLRRLAGLGHQALAQADHDGVVLGKPAREVPERLAHHVGRDRVGVLLDLVQGLLVGPPALSEAREEARAQGRDGRRRRQAPADAGGDERMVVEALVGTAAEPFHLHVLEPQVEAQQQWTRVEGPLGDQVLLRRWAGHCVEASTGAPPRWAPRVEWPGQSGRPP